MFTIKVYPWLVQSNVVLYSFYLSYPFLSVYETQFTFMPALPIHDPILNTQSYPFAAIQMSKWKRNTAVARNGVAIKPLSGRHTRVCTRNTSISVSVEINSNSHFYLSATY